MGKKLTWYFVEAASGGIVAPLSDLLLCDDLIEFTDDPLAAIAKICSAAGEHDILLTPNPASLTNWDTDIVLKRVTESGVESVGAKVLELCQSGELPYIEMKSTLWLHLQRLQNDPTASPEDLRATPIAHSAMKTICGFLNEDGGILIIGLDDDSNVIGIEKEYYIACPKNQTIDGWLQCLRETICSFFSNPDDVLNHLRIEIGCIDNKHVCLITVIPKRKMAICKCKDQKENRVYSRKGSSTEEVGLNLLEEYILIRAKRVGLLG